MALALVAIGCAPAPPIAGPATAAVSAPAAGRITEVKSNLAREDYAGSAACAGCHPEEQEKWAASAMHRMTRLADAGDIAAPFDGARFTFKTDQAWLTRDGAARFVRIESQRFGRHTYRVTRVIGGRHREDFAGVEVEAAQEGAKEVGPPGEERVLPVSYMLASRSFRYKGYSVMNPERPGLKRGSAWSKTCIFCHNTVPYLSTALGALVGPRARPYQGEVVDKLLPPERRATFEVSDPAALDHAVAHEIEFLGGTPPTAGGLPATLRSAVEVTRARFGAAQLVEVGIGCESCHGGCREHVQHERARPSFTPHSPYLRAHAPTETPAQAISRTCARCHQVLFSGYPWTWEGGTRSASIPGGSHVNSGEARDFLLGGCAGQMSCVACHDPHARDDGPRRQELETTAGDRVCLACHPALADPTAQRAHSHHDPAGAGGRCLNCHMPKKNLSLDSRRTRYHRIGAPTDRARVEGDRPLECALCHPHAKVGALVLAMERWWGKSYDRAALARLYGSLDAEVLAATLSSGKPHEQAVAIAVLGETRDRALAPALSRQLTNPVPLVRYYAAAALEAALGEASPVDLHTDDDEILRQAARWLARAGLAAPASARPPGAPPSPATTPATEPEGVSSD